MNQARHSEVCAIVRTADKFEPVPGHIAGRTGRSTDQWLAFEVGPHRLAVELDRVALVARGRFDVRNPEEAPRCCRDFTSLAPPAPLAFARLLFDVAPPIMLDDARLLLIVDDTRRFGLVVDRVREVVRIAPERVESATGRVPARFERLVSSLCCSLADGPLMLLAIERVVFAPVDTPTAMDSRSVIHESSGG